MRILDFGHVAMGKTVEETEREIREAVQFQIESLECGSLLPLFLAPACRSGVDKIEGRFNACGEKERMKPFAELAPQTKAGASSRTPK